MITKSTKIRLNRYLSVKQDGVEMYVEDLPDTDSVQQEHILSCRERLKLIRQVMPKAKWRMTIETQWRCQGETRYQVMDVETGETENVTV